MFASDKPITCFFYMSFNDEQNYASASDHVSIPTSHFQLHVTFNAKNNRIKRNTVSEIVNNGYECLFLSVHSVFVFFLVAFSNFTCQRIVPSALLSTKYLPNEPNY